MAKTKAKTTKQETKPRGLSVIRCEMHLIRRVEMTSRGLRSPIAMLPNALAEGWRRAMHSDARGRFGFMWACADCCRGVEANAGD